MRRDGVRADELLVEKADLRLGKLVSKSGVRVELVMLPVLR